MSSVLMPRDDLKLSFSRSFPCPQHSSYKKKTKKTKKKKKKKKNTHHITQWCYSHDSLMPEESQALQKEIVSLKL